MQSSHGFSWLRTFFEAIEDVKIFDTIKLMVGNDASVVRWNEVFAPEFVNFGDLLMYTYVKNFKIFKFEFSF